MKMIGMSRERSRSRIRRAVWMPSMVGILMSSRMTAKSPMSRRFIASTPDCAVTSSRSTPDSTESSAARLAALSSTNSTRASPFASRRSEPDSGAAFISPPGPPAQSGKRRARVISKPAGRHGSRHSIRGNDRTAGERSAGRCRRRPAGRTGTGSGSSPPARCAAPPPAGRTTQLRHKIKSNSLKLYPDSMLNWAQTIARLSLRAIATLPPDPSRYASNVRVPPIIR